jgi:hypothetical protein
LAKQIVQSLPDNSKHKEYIHFYADIIEQFILSDDDIDTLTTLLQRLEDPQYNINLFNTKKMHDLLVSMIKTEVDRLGKQAKQEGGRQLKLVLGRSRKITKVGRKSMITYKGKQMSLTEARALEKKLKAKTNK